MYLLILLEREEPFLLGLLRFNRGFRFLRDYGLRGGMRFVEERGILGLVLL